MIIETHLISQLVFNKLNYNEYHTDHPENKGYGGATVLVKTTLLQITVPATALRMMYFESITSHDCSLVVRRQRLIIGKYLHSLNEYHSHFDKYLLKFQS